MLFGGLDEVRRSRESIWKKFSAMTVYGTILEKYSRARTPPGSTIARCPTGVTARENRVRAARKATVAIHGIRSCGLLDGPGVFQSTLGGRRSHGVASHGPGSTRTRSMCSGARMDEIPHHQMGRKPAKYPRIVRWSGFLSATASLGSTALGAGHGFDGKRRWTWLWTGFKRIHGLRGHAGFRFRSGASSDDSSVSKHV